MADKLSKQHMCQLWLDQEIDKAIDTKECPSVSDKRIRGEVNRLFEARYKARSIERRMQRKIQQSKPKTVEKSKVATRVASSKNYGAMIPPSPEALKLREGPRDRWLGKELGERWDKLTDRQHVFLSELMMAIGQVDTESRDFFLDYIESQWCSICGDKAVYSEQVREYLFECGCAQ